MAKIVLITPGQPTSNPRLVKEAIALFEAGYEVIVIYNFWSVWTDEADRVLIQQYPSIQWIRVGGHPIENRFQYWLSRIRHKGYKSLSARFPGNRHWHESSLVRCNQQLIRAARSIPADLYIAHNLGALPAAAKAAAANQSKYAFDAEDYHRSQLSDDPLQKLRATAIEDAYFKNARYITTASPLIGEAYRGLYPELSFITVNNVFGLRQQPSFKPLDPSVLRLFWFSQTVGLKRGLQETIAAMNRVQDFPIRLTILGKDTHGVRPLLQQLLTNNQHQIVFLDPCHEQALIDESSNHHIGLAIEPGFSVNNKIALSNKLFTYLLAGNAVVFSNTPAQEKFYRENEGIGWLYSIGNTEELAQIFCRLFQDPALLDIYRKAAWTMAREKYNWENEKELFLEQVRRVI